MQDPLWLGILRSVFASRFLIAGAKWSRRPKQMKWTPARRRPRYPSAMSAKNVHRVSIAGNYLHHAPSQQSSAPAERRAPGNTVSLCTESHGTSVSSVRDDVIFIQEAFDGLQPPGATRFRRRRSDCRQMGFKWDSFTNVSTLIFASVHICCGSAETGPRC